jgi:hypothetical protein
LGSSSEGASYGYDFNCNKNGVDGVNMDLLKQGDTPFDFYYTTGIENLAYGSDSPWYKQILIQDKRDANCYEYPPYRDATVQLAISSAAAALSLGIGGIAAGGFTYGGIISRGVFSVATDLTLDSDLRQICFGNSPQGSFCAARLGLTFFIGAATGGQSGGLIGKVNTKTGKISFSSNLASTSTKPLRPLSADILSSGENALEGRAKNVLKESFEIPGSVCFDGDTLISMADGEVKEIQNISVGEKVLSYNLTSHSYIFSEVKIISKHFSEDIYLINNKTRVTSGHPFWTKEYGWAAINNSEIKEHPELELAKLSVGLHLLDENGSYVELGSIERIYNISLEVYNFVDLAENHNYFADGVLVHNQGNPCGKLQGIVDNPVLSRQQTYKNILGAGGSFKDEVFKQLFSSFMARNTLTSSNFENLVLEATDLLQKHSFLFPKKADPKFKILSLGKKMFAQNKYLVTESNAKLIESETNFYYSFATKLRQRFTSRGSNLPFSDDIVIGGQKYVRFNKVFNDDEGVPTYFVTHLQPADGNMQKSYLYLEDFKKGSPYFNRYITKDFLELGDSELLSLSSYDGSPINNHLKNLITIVNSPESTREAKAKAIAAFEWIFFSANPVGRGGASIGDVLSNMLQQQAGFRLRSQFVSQDFEALSTSYADYLASRSVQLLSQ